MDAEKTANNFRWLVFAAPGRLAMRVIYTLGMLVHHIGCIVYVASAEILRLTASETMNT